MKAYAARIVDGVVTQVIVGDPVWAESRLGGVWVGSPSKVGVGWLLQDEQLVPPPAPEPDPEMPGDVL